MKSLTASLAPILAFCGLAAMAVPARAETLDLVCTLDTYVGPGPSGPYNGPDLHFSVDLAKAVVTDSSGSSFPASISTTSIAWAEPRSDNDHMDLKFAIDRTTGKVIYDQTFQGRPNGTTTGKCRQATQKF